MNHFSSVLLRKTSDSPQFTWGKLSLFFLFLFTLSSSYGQCPNYPDGADPQPVPINFTIDVYWPAYGEENALYLVNNFTGFQTGQVCYQTIQSGAPCFQSTLDNYGTSSPVTNVTLGTLTSVGGCNEFRLVLRDSYADGWNSSGYIILYANGVNVGQYNMPSGGTTNINFTLPVSILESTTWGREDYAKDITISGTGCASGNLTLGAGAYQDLIVPAETYFNYAFNAGPNVSGFEATVIAGGTGASSQSFSSNQPNWFSGSETTTLRVRTKRNNCTWSCTGSAFNYTMQAPLLPNVTDGSNCGAGNVTLSSTPSGGGMIQWYSAQTGGTLLGSGNSFTTPVISSTTTYYVSASNITGCSSERIPVIATITEGPAVTASITSSETSICPGDNVTFTATNVNGGASPSYQWQINNQNVGTNSNQFSSTSLNNGDVVTVIVTADPSIACVSGSPTTSNSITIGVAQGDSPGVLSGASAVCFGDQIVYTTSGDAGGNWNSSDLSVATIDNQGNINAIGTGWSEISYTVQGACQQETATAILIVNTLPVINTGGDVNACLGEEIILNATASNGSITWDNGVQNGVGFIPSGNSVYTATATDNGCSSTASVNVVVNDYPTIVAGSDLTVCEGEEVTLSATASEGNITWDNGVTDGTPFVATSSNTYTATANNQGCETTSSLELTVNPSPNLQIPSDFAVCSGDQAILNATVSNGTVQWDNGVIDGEVFYPTGTNTYTAEATYNDCMATASVVVTVNQTPTLTVGEDVTVCSGEEVTLNATASNGTISWNNGVTNGVAFTATTSGVYTATVDNNGCTASESVNVTVNETPIISTNTNVVACEGESITLNASASSGTISWNNGVTNGVAFNPTSSGIYTVTADANGCTNFVDVAVSINPFPTINAGNDITVCNGNEVTLSATSSGGTVMWNNGVTNGVPFTPTLTRTYTVTVTENGCTSVDQVVVTVVSNPTVTANNMTTCTETQPIPLIGSPAGGTFTGDFVLNNFFSPNASGEGSFVVVYSYTDANGCSASASATVLVEVCDETGLAENDLFSLDIYPNPARDFVMIQVDKATIQNVQVMSMTGQIISVNSTVVDDSTYQLETTTLAKGTYFIQVETNYGSTVKKVVIL